MYALKFVPHLFTSNSPAAKTADTSFKWDADRDDTKCVGIKATMAKGDSIRGDITLSLPAMQKVGFIKIMQRKS